MKQQIEAAIWELFGLEVEVSLSRPEPEFGDYATNIALQLAKQVGDNPRKIAEKIAGKLAESGEYEAVEVAGPGFINITLGQTALIKLAQREPTRFREGKVVVIETNNPNPFKAMHIGHAYNAILADTMANLLEASGATTHRVSYHGDVGTHVGRSMWAILRETHGDIHVLEDIEPDKRNEFMSKMYAEGSKAAKESSDVKREVDHLARQSFTLDDPTYKALYDLCARWSYEQIDALVARLGNVPIERRYVESETEIPGKKLIIDNTPQIFKQSDGAYIFEGSHYGSFDNIYIGSSGNGLYGAHDMGLIQLKYRDYPKLDMSIVVTGSEQGAYFKGVIAASELAIPELKGKLFNYPTGLVKLSTGKMSSRTGEVIEVGWLFDEFGKAVEARGGEPSDEIVAGALRYQFLKVKIGSDVVFDISDAVSLSGNTGSYLQYAHARARAILRKISVEIPKLSDVRAEDRLLVRKLGEYAEVVVLAERQLEPHHICNYLYELAQEFNRYYERNRVIGDEFELHRVGLVALYADTLKAGLAILGINAPDKM
ncbi:MAG TPA: arginine--tRNA ligase [Candidatus Saccharimonadaceae bacterium]|nr:arginine--tRNA ligase [Candidatus Saccharimonadaceae bacterium]